MARHRVAIIGSGNIGTDLMIKILRLSDVLEMGVFVGIDPESDGLRRAQGMGVATTHEGIDGLVAHPMFPEIEIVFDATSARAHIRHAEILRQHGKRVIDLTPAAIGPYVVPVANLDQHLDADNVNMVTCGGQATIPIVWAVSRVAPVQYAEIVASIASRSAGPGTRANIDEFTETTARGIEQVGGARRGKAIIVLNPAEPPLIMRDTVYVLCDPADPEAITASIRAVVAEVAEYVPGYRLLKDPIIDEVTVSMPDVGEVTGMKVTCLLEVEGAAHYLPKYAGNLDIMTSAALRMGEKMAAASVASGA
ncbi:MAG TPA: acetaldehyde dehydrogenase (acetylating) [Candidatus Kapabacteria bacterium]|jgi:acetaldehyde dehydrogenase|nr:acetaldehyde dehydrogenase (acetylating) [Candidatus Kapabacteria bacterium]